jgi:fumarylacetoacetate (FAA) hydrolase family protein
MSFRLTPDLDLPSDWRQGRFLGRVDLGDGPVPILVDGGEVFDMTRVALTVAELVANGTIDTPGESLGPLDRLDVGTTADARVRRIGGSLRRVEPGSQAATDLKAALIDDGMWSQYLEVAIGPDAEIFSKCPPLAALGWGAEIGVRSDSTWNNPEPEVVLLCTPQGRAVGATLGNDVNLRDFEGRSALLLSKAKDNNASTAIGPLIRLFDDGFTMADVRTAEVSLRIEGEDGYVLDGASSMREISRDPEELARQAMSEHQYPDGFVLFLGTLFAPTQDRDEPGRGFTHKPGDRVTIATPALGRLVNRVTTSKAAEPWTFGIGALMRNLAGRGLLARA